MALQEVTVTLRTLWLRGEGQAPPGMVLGCKHYWGSGLGVGAPGLSWGTRTAAAMSECGEGKQMWRGARDAAASGPHCRRHQP